MMMRVDSDSLGIGIVSGIAQFIDMHGKWSCTVSGMSMIW